jgi:transposase
MEQYVALDVSLKEISVCVIDGKGAVTFEGKVAAEPGALVSLIRKRAPQAARVGLETGATSPWLYHSLKKADLPVVLMDARHAHAALSMRPTKSDRSDARGLAEMLRMGWYRAVTAKSFTAHERMALLGARRHLVEIRVELDGQIRGLLKTFGLILGKGNTDVLIRRAETLAEGNPVISSLVAKLAEVQRQVVAQVAALDRDIRPQRAHPQAVHDGARRRADHRPGVPLHHR